MNLAAYLYYIHNALKLFYYFRRKNELEIGTYSSDVLSDFRRMLSIKSDGKNQTQDFKVQQMPRYVIKID